MKQLYVVTDLQYGSTGKGLFSAYLARDKGPDTIFTAWAPNAGHTVVHNDGTKFVTCALPSGMITAGESLKRIMIGPGSVINPTLLMMEIDKYARYLHGVQIYIHECAAVVTEEHRQAESSYGYKIGSTMKGVGEAVIAKIRRNTESPNTAAHALIGTPLEGFIIDRYEYNFQASRAEVAILEGAQGFSLSINQGFYPYTTSRDCTTHQLLSDCAIPYHHFNTTVFGVARTYPIRVANRFDKDTGIQIGTSGPCYGDQHEIDWEDIGLKPEMTTVTNLPRRIFTFSENQIADAILMDGVDAVFLNFVNYCTEERAEEIIKAIERYAPVQWLGTGPRCEDLVMREATIS